MLGRLMQRSTTRVLTTNVGSLARPHDLLEVMREKSTGGRTTLTHSPPWSAPRSATRCASKPTAGST